MFSLFIHFYRRQLPICSFDYTTFIPYLPLKDKNSATAAPYILYHSNDFSILYFCPFKSFCFSYRLLRSLHSSFMRSNCNNIPLGNSALCSYIHQPDYGLYYCFPLATLISTPSLSDFSLPCPFRKGLFLPLF